MAGLGVDLHPYYQRGVSALPGVEYGWLKMTDGGSVYSKGGFTADAHAQLFRRLGIPFGGYCYGQPGDGAAHFQVLWNECLRLGGTGVAPAIDIESNPQIHTWSISEAIGYGRAFCAAARRAGVRPTVYMNDSMAGACRPAAWPEAPVLWIARYGAVPQHTRYDVHQFDDKGTLPGSAGAVDLNQAYSAVHLLTTPANGKDGDMDQRQSDQLDKIHEQLMGTKDPRAGWPGFPSFKYPDHHATPVDFIRHIDENLLNLTAVVSKLAADVAALKAAKP